MSRTPFLIHNFLHFDVYVVMILIFPANQKRCASSSKNVAILSLWSKRAIIGLGLSDSETGTIFLQPPLISFKRDKYVGNFLVRSALITNEQAGTYKCARSRCKTCLFILNTSKISGPKRSVKITERFTSTSANVIYCITCTLCKKLYIGETGRRLGYRFREHLRDVEKDDKDASKPIGRHFNLHNHSKQRMAICGLSLPQGTIENRKNLEQKFIFQTNAFHSIHAFLFLTALPCYHQ